MEDPLNALSELFMSDEDGDELDSETLSFDLDTATVAGKDTTKIKDEMQELQAKMKILQAQLMNAEKKPEAGPATKAADAKSIAKTEPQRNNKRPLETRNESMISTTRVARQPTNHATPQQEKTNSRERHQAAAPPTKKPCLSRTLPDADKRAQPASVSKPVKSQYQKPPLKQVDARPGNSNEGFTDSLSGLRLISPKVSSQLLDSRMKDRKFIKLHMISKSLSGADVEGDWVTVGVIARKMPAKKGSNGKTFSVWKLSGMTCGHEDDTIGLFLFGNVYQEHWKIPEGSAIALLNANVMPSRDKADKGDIAITVDNPQKIMELGISKDFGLCQGMRKSDGQQCSNYVNKKYGEYCEYHVQRAYKKARSQRMECQSGYGAPANMKKVKQEISKSVYFHNGKTVTLDMPKSTKKQKDFKAKMQAKIKNEEASDSFKGLLQAPSVGARNLAKHKEVLTTDSFGKHSTTQTSGTTKGRQAHTPKPSSRLTEEMNEPTIRRSANSTPKNMTTLLSLTPKLSTGEGDFIEFVDSGDTIMSNALDNRFDKENNAGNANFKQRLSNATNKADDESKARALAYIRRNGPNKTVDPKEKVRRALEANQPEEKDSQEGSSQSVLSDIFGPLDLSSDKGKQVVAAESSHVGTVKEACAERMEQYFTTLEKKERYEEKMNSITELSVTLVCCKTCDYLAESASSMCREQNHHTIKVNGKKRFYECNNCKQRTISYNRIPTDGCRNCGQTSFTRTSMLKESRGPKIGKETLLVRGEEKKFINS